MRNGWRATASTTLDLYQSLTSRPWHAPDRLAGVGAPRTWPMRWCPTLANLYRESRAHGSALVMGVLRADGARTRHATTTRCWRSTSSVELYDKSHLVPFAEFFPGASLRTHLAAAHEPAVFGFHPRARHCSRRCRRAGLRARPVDLLRGRLRQRDVAVLPHADPLVNVTNDAWFGHSTRATSTCRSPACGRSRPAATWCGPATMGFRRSSARTAKSWPRPRNSSPRCCVGSVMARGAYALCPCWQLAVVMPCRAGAGSPVGAE